ncbi:MAG: hypothetical protein NVS3B21_16270 [Acidimicrobiales bacterium]
MDGSVREQQETHATDTAALGHYLEEQSSEVANTVLDRCTGFLDTYPPDDRARISRDIVRTCTLATATVGHFLVTGEAASPQEWQTLSAVGKAPAAEAITLADMTKLYFSWRDVALEYVREHCRTNPCDSECLQRAAEAIRRGCDSSLVRTARRFDQRRRELQEQLADEQARLAHLARHDALTGLPNRHSLFEHLGRVVERCHSTGEGAAVLFVDLDHFKAVNDTLGHSTGDLLLCAVANRLRGAVVATDTVARLGGDEFVVLCPGLDAPEDQARRIAERIDDAMRTPFPINGTSLSSSASVGVTVVRPGDDPEHLLSQADSAMYHAKKGGAGRHEMFSKLDDVDGDGAVADSAAELAH